MFFRRKSTNRRLGREHVLDVKLRSSQVRAARTRLLVLVGGTIFSCIFGTYLLWRAGGWALDTLVYENQAFAIREIDLQTDGIIAIESLRRWAGVKPGQNLLALDLSRVRRDLEMVPLIQTVSLERILPHTLRIKVTEREPVAQANVPRPRPGGGIDLAVFQVDPDGWVMVPLDSHQRATSATQINETFPLISGIQPSELQPGHRLEAPQALAALQLIVAFERSPMANLTDITRIDISEREVLIATTSQNSLISFGLNDMDQQLRRWHDIFEMGQRLGRAIATLDLAVTNNIPARWLEASAVPSDPPKSPRTMRSKRKHV
jgi:cell division septal protein FtsQ